MDLNNKPLTTEEVLTKYSFKNYLNNKISMSIFILYIFSIIAIPVFILNYYTELAENRMHLQLATFVISGVCVFIFVRSFFYSIKYMDFKYSKKYIEQHECSNVLEAAEEYRIIKNYMILVNEQPRQLFKFEYSAIAKYISKEKAKYKKEKNQEDCNKLYNKLK